MDSDSLRPASGRLAGKQSTDQALVVEEALRKQTRKQTHTERSSEAFSFGWTPTPTNMNAEPLVPSQSPRFDRNGRISPPFFFLAQTSRPPYSDPIRGQHARKPRPKPRLPRPRHHRI